MPDLSGLGDLVVTVGGDITPLTSALDEIPAAAQASAAQIQAAFDALPSATEGVNQSLANLSAGLNDAGDAAQQTMGQITTLPPALHDTAEASAELSDKFHELAITGLELAGIGLTLEALKESILGALEAFGEFQVAAEAMTAMTKNAEGVKAAMEGIPDLANRIGVSIQSLEGAFTKFTRYGIDLQQIPAALSAIADAAKASHVDFDTAAAAWERAVNTGNVTLRTVQNMGISMNDLAKAMNMAGAPAADVTKAFKAIADTSDGTLASTQRLNDLFKAVPENIRGMAAAADDVKKAFTVMGNDIHEMAVTIGEALTQLGQSGGLGAFKITLDAVTIVLTGLIDVVAQFVTVAVGGFKLVRDVTEQVATVLSDIFSGNWKKAAEDMAAGDQKIAQDIIDTGNKIQSNFVQTGAIVAKEWDDMGKAAGVAAEKTKTAADQMRDSVQKMGDQISQTLVNAQNMFALIQQAFAAGTVGPAAYTKALQELNAAQMEANAGFENAKTVMAIVANSYRELLVNVANAQTTLRAVVADMAAGSASATQYSAALIALNKAQMEVNNGYEKAHTAFLLAVDDFSKLIVQSANAKTTLDAVAQAVLNGQSSMTQFDQALQKVNADFMATHGGAQDFATVVEMIGVSMQKMAVEAQNSQMSLQAWLDKMAAGYPVLQNVIDAMDKVAASYEKAHGGELDLASATDLVTAAHLKLQLAADKANVTLSAAYALADKGTIGYTELTNYINKAAQANEALSGSHSKVAAAANSAATAQNNLNSAMQHGVTQSLNNVNVENDYATSLAVVEGRLVHIGIAYGDTVKQASGYLGALQQINGQTTQFGVDTTAAAGSAGDFATNLAKVNGQWQNLTSGAASADAVVNQLSADMQTAAVSAGTLAQAVSRGIVTGASQGGSGTVAGQPGDVVTERNDYGAIVSQTTLGTPLQRAQKALSDLQGPQQLQQIYDQIAHLGAAGTTLNAAGTALQVAATVQQDAAQTAYDAAKAQLVGAKQLEIAANATATGADAISAGVLAAADAANQVASDASAAIVMSSTIAAAATQAVTLATNTMVATAQVVAAVATKAGVPGFTTFTAFTTPAPNLPNVGPSGASTGGLAFAPPVFPTGPNTGPVNINVNGSQFIQNLMNEFVQNLQTQGVRLVRG